MISSTPATGGAPLMAAMALKNTPNPSVTIMPPLSFIAHAPGVGGHGAVPRAVAGGVWTPDLGRCRHRPKAPFGTCQARAHGSIASTPMSKAHRGFIGPRDVSGSLRHTQAELVAQFHVRTRPWVADLLIQP